MKVKAFVPAGQHLSVSSNRTIGGAGHESSPRLRHMQLSTSAAVIKFLYGNKNRIFSNFVANS
jgi:hypothetical protein